MLYLAAVEYREANGLTLGDLDFARSTIESVAKSIKSRPTWWFSGSQFMLRDGTDSLKNKPSPKPRNLNKFNEAMDQVERAMAQAELSRKTAKLTDLRKDITGAVNRGNV
ncbi:Hypothetical predicted protein, partial [Paramuricea clavata]